MSDAQQKQTLVGVILLIGMIFAFAAASISWAEVDLQAYSGQKLDVITWEEDITKAYERVSPEFERITGIKIKWHQESEPSAREKAMLDWVSGAGVYDMSVGDCWHLPRAAAAEYILPLDSFPKSLQTKWYLDSTLSPKFVEGLSYNGKIYSLPYYREVGILHYRKDLLQKYGILVPTTTDEFTEAARKLTLDLDGDGKTDIYGTAMRGMRGEENPVVSASFPWIFGGNWLDSDMKPTLNSPEFVEGIDWYANVLKKYGPPDVSRYSWVEVQDSFAAGKIALSFASSVFAGRFLDPRYSQVVDKVGFALGPAGPRIPLTERYPPLFASIGFPINVDSPNPEAAWIYLQWLTSDQLALRLANELPLTTFPNEAALKSEAIRNQVGWEAIKTIIDASQLANPEYMPHLPEFAELVDILGNAVSKLITGEEVDAKTALDKANEETYKVLEKAGYYR